MREISFRMWTGRRMIYDRPEEPVAFGISAAGIYTLEPQGEGYERQGSGYVLKWHPTWVPMQYTGLKDANGQKIYEGDVLEFDIGAPGHPRIERNPVVPYGMGFAIEREDGYWHGTTVIQDYGGRVIGNIYEHPDLIPAPPRTQSA